MANPRPKLTERSAAWIEILSSVERALATTLHEVERREETLSVASTMDNSANSPAAQLSQFSQRWQGLWLRYTRAEKETSNAEATLAAAEQELRSQLDSLGTCRQNLAQWLSRAVG